MLEMQPFVLLALCPDLIFFLCRNKTPKKKQPTCLQNKGKPEKTTLGLITQIEQKMALQGKNAQKDIISGIIFTQPRGRGVMEKVVLWGCLVSFPGCGSKTTMRPQLSRALPEQCTAAKRGKGCLGKGGCETDGSHFLSPRQLAFTRCHFSALAMIYLVNVRIGEHCWVPEAGGVPSQPKTDRGKHVPEREGHTIQSALCSPGSSGRCSVFDLVCFS